MNTASASASASYAADPTRLTPPPSPVFHPVIPNPPPWLRYRALIPAALLTGAIIGLIGHSILPVCLLPVLAVAYAARAHKAELRRHSARQRSAVVSLCAALRAELDGGAQPHIALLEAVWCRKELRDLAVRISDPNAIRAPAGLPYETAELLAAAALAAPGRSGLSALAACWRATEEHGLPLTAAAAGIESALRAEEQRQLLLDAELSGVRTTMGLLAVLPVFGLLLGSSLGTRPLHTLLQTFGGQACLVSGTALELIGLWWTDRLVADVTGVTGVPGSPSLRHPWRRRFLRRSLLDCQ